MSKPVPADWQGITAVIRNHGPHILEWLKCGNCENEELIVHDFQESALLSCGHRAATHWESAWMVQSAADRVQERKRG